MDYFVDVIVPINIKQLLTYALPKHLEKHCTIGSRVAVPVGNKNLYTACKMSPNVKYTFGYLWIIARYLDDSSIAFHIYFT